MLVNQVIKPVIILDSLCVHAVIEPETAVSFLSHPGLDVSRSSSGFLGLVGEIISCPIIVSPSIFIFLCVVINLNVKSEKLLSIPKSHQ